MLMCVVALDMRSGRRIDMGFTLPIHEEHRADKSVRKREGFPLVFFHKLVIGFLNENPLL